MTYSGLGYVSFLVSCLYKGELCTLSLVVLMNKTESNLNLPKECCLLQAWPLGHGFNIHHLPHLTGWTALYKHARKTDEADVHPRFDHMNIWQMYCRSRGNDHEDAIINGCSHARAGQRQLWSRCQGSPRFFLSSRYKTRWTPLPFTIFFLFGRNVWTYEVAPKGKTTREPQLRTLAQRTKNFQRCTTRK